MDPTLTDPQSQSRARQVFAAGDLVAGRYEIVALLGQGGMGEVYHARDQMLGTDVALKTLRADRAAETVRLERFRREVQTARKVTHPNVCRLFELGFTDDGVPFFTMELCAGKNLRERLQRDGKMSLEAALPMVRQMAAALGALHKAGVVHRDFKQSNVMLDGERVVVTDFGLALATDASQDLTGSGELLGSAAYMAPEQVEGGSVGPATDVYALGIVMYEMVTGQQPFRAETPLATAMQRLTKPPPAPRAIAPAVGAHWNDIILRCLRRDPARRYATPDEVVKALESRPKLRVPWRPLIAFVLAAGALAGVRTLRRHSLGPRPTLAVARFADATGKAETAWLGTALAELVSTELGAGGEVRLVPAERVARAQRTLGDKPPSALAEAVESRLVLSGSYVPAADGSVRAQLVLEDAANGRNLARIDESGSDLNVVAARAGSRLRRELGLKDPEKGSGASLPRDPQAARLYAEGIERQRNFDALGAKAQLEQAIAIEPGFALLHLALADTLADLSEDHAAAAEAKKALALAHDLTRQERLRIEAQAARGDAQWDEAIRLYDAIFTFYPDDLEAGLALARAQDNAHRDKLAIQTVERLRRLPDGDDPRVDLEEAQAAQGLSDYERSGAAADRAIQKARARGQGRVVADALINKAHAFRYQGQIEPALAAATEAAQLYHQAGDRAGEGRSLVVLAIMALGRADADAGEKYAREAYALLQACGDRVDSAWAMMTLGRVQEHKGKLDDALTSFHQVEKIDHDLGAKGEEASALINAGVVYEFQGRLRESQAVMEKALALVREIGRRIDEVNALGNLTELSRFQGRLADAKSYIQQTLKIAREIGARDLIAQLLSISALIDTERGDLRAARAQIEDAKKMNAESKSEQTLNSIEGNESILLMEEGRPADALALDRASIPRLQKSGEIDNELSVRTGVIDALVAMGKKDEAQRELEAAAPLAGKTQMAMQRWGYEVSRGRVLAATGHRAEAMKLWRGILEECKRANYVDLALEIRLAMRQDLPALAKDARALGYVLIARKAQR
jgi:tetratricopeptide (TPR) repeat protein/tRNA A-37 threonylcarbamoyl transferase component Bud32